MDGDRKVPMLNIGITNLEAKAWLKANFTDKPGVTTTTRKLSKGLRKWCGEMGCLVSGELKDAVESRCPNVNIFPRTPERMDTIADFVKLLSVKDEKNVDFLCDACSLIITPGINLGFHFDVSQDYRDGWEWITSSSRVLDVEKFPVEAKLLLKKIW